MCVSDGWSLTHWNTQVKVEIKSLEIPVHYFLQIEKLSPEPPFEEILQVLLNFFVTMFWEPALMAFTSLLPNGLGNNL